MKGEKMLDKMSARCTALSVDSGPNKYIDGACVLADADGQSRALFSCVAIPTAKAVRLIRSFAETR